MRTFALFRVSVWEQCIVRLIKKKKEKENHIFYVYMRICISFLFFIPGMARGLYDHILHFVQMEKRMSLLCCVTVGCCMCCVFLFLKGVSASQKHVVVNEGMCKGD